MRKIRKLFIIAALAVAAVILSWALLEKAYVAPIIMYHSVNPKQNPAINRLIVSPEAFELQMRFLKERKYNILPLSKLAELIKEKKMIPPRTIAITLDDGYKDNYTYAFPILKKYNIPATIFVIINEVGRQEGDRLSWDDIRKMQDSGLIVFGSHTMDPTPLIDIKSEEKQVKEIVDSKKALEEKMGRRADLFSYPEGMFNAKIRKMVIDAGYNVAVATNPGENYPNDDIFALKRLRISENSKNLFIFWFETNGYYTFFKEHKRKKHGKRT